MTSFQTLHEEPKSREIFKDLFKIAFEVNEPILPMKKIMHWHVVKEAIGAKTPRLDESNTHVFGGHFYNFSTPDITQSEIQDGITFGKNHGSQVFLIPSVRDDINDASLIKANFIKIPWFIESTFDIETDVDTDLIGRIGTKRHKNLSKAFRKAEQDYIVRWVKASELVENRELLNDIAELHLQNTLKYNHPANIYPLEAIKRILNSDLAKHLVIGCRFEKSKQKPVQMVLCMEDQERSHFYTLVQGRDYSHEAEGQNLYNAFFYQIYQYAQERKFKTIFLGRGNHELKKRLGANRFRILNNWVYSSDVDLKNELKIVEAAAKEKLNLHKWKAENE